MSIPLEVIRELYKCIQCSSCSSVCPILYKLGFSPRRRVLLAKNGVLLEENAWECLQCCMCSSVCPSDIDVAGIISLIRSRLKPPEELLLVSKNVFEKGVSLEPLRDSMYKVKSSRKEFVEALKNLVKNKLFKANTISLLKSYVRSSKLNLRRGYSKLYLHPGCIALNMYPSITKAVVEVLGKAGIKVVIEPENFICCGTPLSSAGYGEYPQVLASGIVMARAEDCGADAVITPCNGCQASLVKGASIAAGDKSVREFILNETSKWSFNVSWGMPVLNVSDILVNHIEELGVETDEPLSYFIGCHYSFLSLLTGKLDPPLSSLCSLISRSKIVKFGGEYTCCGGFSKSNPELIHELSSKIISDATNAGSSIILVQCNGCLMNMDRIASTIAIEKPSFASPVHVAQYIASLLELESSYLEDLSYISIRKLMMK